MARRKRSKGEKPEEQQTAIPFQQAQTPEELRVFPFELRTGDRVTVGGTGWEVAATPSGYLKGKMVTVKLRKPGDPTATNVEHWPAHERVTVRRAPASADPGPSPR